MVALSGDNYATKHNLATYLKVLMLFKKVLELEVQLQNNKTLDNTQLENIYQQLLLKVMQTDLETFKALMQKSIKELQTWAKAQR